MAGKSPVLPADAWVRSSVMEKKLLELVRDGLLRPRTSRDLPKWRASPANNREPAPPEGYVVSFVAFHERGFGVPLSRFMQAIPHYYGVELHHFAPNSISQAAIFAAICEGYLGIEPHWTLWLHLFKVEHFAKKASEKGVRRAVHTRSYTIQVWPGRGELYIPAQLISSNNGWHNGWFYLRNDDGQLPRFSGQVLMSQKESWAYDVIEEDQPKL
jgi:hypothetical protein